MSSLLAALLSLLLAGTTLASPPQWELDQRLGRAAARGDLEAVLAALEAGAELDAIVAADGTNSTALEKAIYREHWEVAWLLLERGAALRRVDDLGVWPAALAAAHGNTELLGAIVTRARSDDPSADFGYALIRAAGEGKAGALELLLAAGVDPNTLPRENMPTALANAARRGEPEIAHRLLDRGARPRAWERQGLRAAEAAAIHADRVLLARIASLAPAAEPGALYGPAAAQASWYGHTETLVDLLALGVEATAVVDNSFLFDIPGGGQRDRPPQPLLAYATDEQRWSSARLLLDAGADPVGGDVLGRAAGAGSLEMVRDLETRGVDLHAEGVCGNALSALARRRAGDEPALLETAVFLLGHGVDPNLPCEGRLPLTWLSDGDTQLAVAYRAAGARAGTTMAYKFRQARRAVRGAATQAVLVVAVLLGGGM